MQHPQVPLVCLLLLLSSNTHSQHRDPLEYIRILESAERVKKLQVERVIDVMNPQPGERIADLGAGSGLFTRPLARRVKPGGVVYAIDIDVDLLNHIDETASEENLENIRTVLATEYDPRIPEKVDLVLICDTLHQIQNPGSYLRDLQRYLQSSGRVVIIDYKGNWPRRFEGVQYTTFDLDAWMTSAGYALHKEYTFLEDNFFVIYRHGSPETEK
jgi:ubiquinone/menaquinone biosynthesis C-methylase UbiE